MGLIKKNDIPYGGGGSVDAYTKAETDTLLGNKQDTLVSGTNIKTVNGISLLGSGNIPVSGGADEFLFVPTDQDDWQDIPTQGEGVKGVELTTPYTYEELVASGKQIAVKIDSTSENADSCLVILQHYDDNASNRQFYGYSTYVDWINGEEHYYIDTVQIVKQTRTDKTWLYHRTSEIEGGGAAELFYIPLDVDDFDQPLPGSTDTAYYELPAAYSKTVLAEQVAAGKQLVISLTGWNGTTDETGYFVPVHYRGNDQYDAEFFSVEYPQRRIDVIELGIQQETISGQAKWVATMSLVYPGGSGDSYTKAETDALLDGKQNEITGGTTGQVMMKKSNTDGDIEWKNLIGSGWGVAKVGTFSVGAGSSITVDISDLGITNVNDYEVLPSLISTDATAGFIPKITKATTSFTALGYGGGAVFTYSYAVIAKGYGAANAGNVPNGGTTGQALIKQSNTDGDFDWEDTGVGDLTTLTTTDKTSAVGAINELDAAVKGLGEPFRVKQWASNTLNVEIPYCTEDIGNGSIPKMIFSIDAVEGADYQIVGMIAYEVFDAESGGNRINCWPVCQFTGNGQKELSVRWMCGGTTRKTAKRISAWVLLKHR